MWRYEVLTPCEIHNLRGYLGSLSFKKTDISCAIEQVSWFATFHLTSLDSIFVYDVIQDLLIAAYAPVERLPCEDFAVCSSRRRFHSRAITHPAKECLVR